jgi:DNA-directed RNA polymerase specialized sigma subunit
MRREDQEGIFGYHKDLDKVVEEVEKYDRGVTTETLRNSLDMGREKLRTILAQADALGMVIVEGSTHGRQGRVFYTDNEQLHFDFNTSTRENIEEKVTQKIEELSEDADELRISIQKVTN